MPDLKRVYARAALQRGSGGSALPDVREVREGVSVDVESLVGYARLCGFAVSNALPPTYPHLMAFPLQMLVLADRAFPLPLLGAVHIENRITVHRRLTVDQPLEVAVWAQGLRDHRRGRQVDLVSEVSVAGETGVAWRGVSTYLARGAAHPDAPRSSTPSSDALRAAPPGPRWRLPAGEGRRYAAVSGDWNPIHVHALTARPLGFRTAIAHGMDIYARMLAALGPGLPTEGLASTVWFRKPVPLPSTVQLRTAAGAEGTLSVLMSGGGEVEHAVVENRTTG
ncbi:MAG: MaoC/PaaZ C-terminal domain-containing protein [Terracoccus sp.]